MANLTGGSVVWNFDVNKSKFDSKLNQANKDIQGVGKTAEKSTTIATRGFQTLARVGMAAVIAASVAVGYAITKNVGNAVRRVDTLNNFPRVMANLGYGAEEARGAIKKLDEGVRGLPTSLDNIARAMQAIAPSTKSLDEATKITLALNNALLAGGAPMEIQATAMTQFSQAISKGKPDMIEWRSLAIAMPGQLDQITQSLGYGRGQWQKMAGDISDGERPFSDVLKAIVKLNEEGLGKFPSFADQAKNATSGLGTALANANTAITRGIGNIIQAIGSAGIATAITSIGKTIESALKRVEKAITRLKKFFNENELAMAALKGAALGLAVMFAVALAPAIWGIIIALGIAVLTALPFIAAGAAIGAIAFVIMKNWSKIKSFFLDIFNSVKRAVQSAREAINNLAGGALTFLKARFDNLVSAIKAVTGFIEDHRAGLVTIAQTIAVLVIPALVRLSLQAIKTALLMVAHGAKSGAGFIMSSIRAATAWTIAGIKMTIAAIKATPAMIMHGLRAGAGFIASSISTALAWGRAFLAMTLGAIKTTAAMTTAAIRAGIAWAVALGPVTLIITAVALGALLVIKNWDKVKNWFGRFKSFIGSALSGVGNAIIKPFKTAFDWIMKQIDRVIGAFRRLRDTAGSVTGAPGRAVSNISGLLGRIPGFATGGIVTEPTLAMVGEAGAEAIIPLKDLDKLSNQKQANINISLNMSGVMARSRSDLRDIAKDMVEAIDEELRAKGHKPIMGAS